MASITISDLYLAELEDEMSTLASDDQRYIQRGLGFIAGAILGGLVYDGVKWVVSEVL